MDWTKATDEQLKNIISNDKDCPTHLLSGVVTEMLNRNLLDRLAYRVIIKRFRRIEIAINVLKTTEEDLMQFCRMKIFESVNKYKQGLSCFLYLAFRYLISELRGLEVKAKAEKRKIYDSLLSSDAEMESGEFFINFFPSNMNVEREVIRKISLEEKLGPLSEQEKRTLLLYVKGYCMEEIAEIEHISKSGVSRRMKKITQKISGKEINLSNLGLSNYRKGA